jgi:hypothetical protein
MGALISTYGALQYPASFLKIGSMSPAFWFADSELNSYINNLPISLENHKVYFVAGENESETMVSNVNIVRNNMIAKGIDPINALTKFDSFGTHTESYWRGEFAALYTYLFEDENLASADANAISPKIIQTTTGTLFADGLTESASFDIIGMSGQLVDTFAVTNGIFNLPDHLCSGIYLLISKEHDIKPIKVFVN